ncbi:VOC family protein [Bacillus sp. AK128]
MSNQVCVIGIYVSDLDKAVNFYTNTLDFQVNKKYGSKIVTLVNGEIPMVIEENEEVVYNQNKEVSGIVLAFRTEDIEKTIKHLTDKGVDFVVDEPTSCPPGKYISFRDPFGNILEYIQFENM